MAPTPNFGSLAGKLTFFVSDLALEPCNSDQISAESFVKRLQNTFDVPPVQRGGARISIVVVTVQDGDSYHDE